MKHARTFVYLFFVCLYVKFFRVLAAQVSPIPLVALEALQICLELDVRCEFSKFVADHVFGYSDVQIAFPIVYLELQADEIG